MAIVAVGSKTIIDLSDGKRLSAYLGSNQPRTQIYDVNNETYSPDWTSTSGKLVITPVVYANQEAIALSNSALSVTWKRKEGSGNEATLASGETVSGNVLIVNANKASTVSSGLLTYIAYVTYTDPDTGLPINATADITFALIKTGQNAKAAWISGEQVFKYTEEGGTPSPSQITMTANLQNVTMVKWQYKNSSGAWTDYPTTSDNTTITGTTLVIKPTHAVFNNATLSLRIVTSDPNISDTTSVYKVVDGVGSQGEPGTPASIAFLTNENITFAGNKDGQVAAVTKTSNIVAYTGATKVTPTVGTISGAPTGMTITKGTVTNNEVPLTITIAANATLGGAGQQSGTINIPITAPVATTLKLEWSKVNTGATGASGQNAVVFSLYAPQGTVFVNGAGSLQIKASAYSGSTDITGSATYKWEKYASGSWTTISGQTAATLTVSGSDVTGTGSYRCTMTYDSKTYTDTITLIDKTDNYQATIESTGGDIFKNTQGTSTLICRLFQNGEEVDALSSESGHTYTYTYKWYRRDKDGNAMDSGAVFKTGKSIAIDGDDVTVKTTFVCEVE